MYGSAETSQMAAVIVEPPNAVTTAEVSAQDALRIDRSLSSTRPKERQVTWKIIKLSLKIQWISCRLTMALILWVAAVWVKTRR
jgi:hypothetical protein